MILNKKLLLPLLCIIIPIMYSCRADVDLDNIDTRMDLSMGLVLPVGDISATLNDFIGNGKVEMLTVDENGVFHLGADIEIPTKNFNDFDITKHLSKTEKYFGIYYQLPAEVQSLIEWTGGIIPGTGIPMELQFPLQMKIDGINNAEAKQRFDSALISKAEFYSTISTRDLGIDWSWIDGISVVLGPQFRCATGETIAVYTKGKDHYGYDIQIPIKINDFVLDLTKEKNQVPSMDNVTDTCEFRFIFRFTIPKDGSLKVSQLSAFHYSFGMNLLAFDAAWGYFQLEDAIRDSRSIAMDSILSGWSDMKNMRLRLAEPTISLSLTHHVAIPIRMHLEELSTVSVDESGQRHKNYATWNGQTQTYLEMKETIDPQGPLTDSVTNTWTFDYTEENGRLDKLFDMRPDTLRYGYSIEVAPTAKQHRITNNLTINGKGHADIPLKLKENSEVAFSTTLDSINISRLSLDTLLANAAKVEKANLNHLKMYMTISNAIPFAVNVGVHYLDKDSNEISGISLMEGSNDRTLRLPAPKMEMAAGDRYGSIKEASDTTVIIDITQDKFDKLTTLRKIRLDASLGKNPLPSKLDTTASLKIKIGLAASVQAIVNFNKEDK